MLVPSVARANVAQSFTTMPRGATHVFLVLWLSLAAACCPANDLYVRTAAQDQGALAAPSDVASVGVQLSVEALNHWLAEPDVLHALPAFRKEIALPLAVPLALTLTLSVERLELRVSKVRPAAFEVRASYAVSFGAGEHLAFALPHGALGLPAELRFEAGVALASRADGGVSVMLDLTEPAIASFEVALDLLPDKVRERVGEVVRPLAAVVARMTLAAVHLFDVKPIDLGVGRLAFGLGTFETDAAANELFLGLRPNLSVPFARPARPDFARPLRGDVRVVLDGRVPEAAVRALLHDGALPRRFDGRLRPDPEGSRAFTLDAFAFEAHGLVATFTLWSLCFPTFAAQIRARAGVAEDAEGRFAAHLEGLELIHSDHYADILADKLEEISRLVAGPAGTPGTESAGESGGGPVAESLTSISQRLLNEHPLGLPDPFGLTYRPIAYAFSAERIETEGTLHVIRRAAAAPAAAP